MRNVFIRADKRGRVHTEKSRKIFYIFCSLRKTRLPCGEGADFSETAQTHCCPCAAFQGLKKHHVQFCLFSVVDRHLCLRKRCHIVAEEVHSTSTARTISYVYTKRLTS